MFKSLISVFLESNCPLCQRGAKELICNYCLEGIKNCQLKNNSCQGQTELPVFAWGRYRGQLKRAIAALKYENCPKLGQLMGIWLGRAWLESSFYNKNKKITVVPVPIHPKKLRTRGYNQAELIARGFCRSTGYSLTSHGLKRVKETKAMFGLDFQQRKENLREAIAVGPDFEKNPPKSPVLIVDDIYTSGTTATEAALTLQKRKIAAIGIVTVSIASS